MSDLPHSLNRLKVGTRGSRLALIQTGLVVSALQEAHPNLKIETVIIKTKGDGDLSPIPLDTVGKAWFTAEIDRALTSGQIDLAVHSLKDLPLDLDPALAMLTVLPRADARDAVITHSGKKFAELPAGAVVGTDSARRRAQILHLRPDVQVQSLRGNVQTRLRKLHDHDYDAIVLAAAGLIRLGQETQISDHLDPTQFIPAIGQGALAVEARQNHHELLDLLRRLEHTGTVTSVAAERAFSAAVGGGCQLPVGCYAELTGRHISLHGMIASLAGPGIHYQTISGPSDQATTLGSTLGESLLKKSGINFTGAANGSH